jgi:hypothetical protein
VQNRVGEGFGQKISSILSPGDVLSESSGSGFEKCDYYRFLLQTEDYFGKRIRKSLLTIILKPYYEKMGSCFDAD